MQTDRPTRPRGLWIPLVTPFSDGELDSASFTRLVRHYLNQPVDGLIVAATTGEGLTLSAAECERLATIAAAEMTDSTTPLYLGLAGSDTVGLSARIAATASWPIDGYLISCPYYSRPSQDGLHQHFSALAGATTRPVVIYNIPYRTGVNLANDTLLRLAEIPNVAGLKDCCADAAQTFDLLRRKPASFSVMTGEDAQFFTSLTHGAEGAILASAHIETATFAEIVRTVAADDLSGALGRWRAIADLVPLLFAEPSPAAIKYWLWREGRIESPELRLPMTPASTALAARIDAARDARRLCA